MKKPFYCSVLCIVFFCLFNPTLNAQKQTAKYGVSMTENSNGYYEYLPKGYASSSDKKFPLLLFFHGMGERGDGSAAQLPLVLRNGPAKQINQGIFPDQFSVDGQTFSFIVLSPQFTIWPGPEEVDNIINYALEHYKVDASRIYLTGLSMGGGMVWDYVGETAAYANRVAAIVPVCGACWPANYRCENIATGDVAVWATHNDGDPTVPVQYTNDFVKNINNLPAPPKPLAKKTIFNSSSHDAWTKTYDLSFEDNGLNIYEWMLQYDNLGVLPITGFDFSIHKVNKDEILLKWSTETETNSQGFAIERSTDGVNFARITFVKSKSIAGEGASYNFTDEKPINGKNYYRIKQLDKDGNYAYSPIKTIEIQKKIAINIFPNPVDNILQIKASIAFTNASVIIRDVNGQVVKKSKISGIGSISLSVENLTAGMYSLSINNNQTNYQLSFIKN